MRTVVRDEMNREIGWIEESDYYIYYHSWRYGLVGQYDKQTRLYRRWKAIPSRSNLSSNNADYGMSDIMYWG